MSRAVHRLDANRVGDFYRLHRDVCRAEWCLCAAWWVETWDGWSERRTEQNREVRDSLFARGIYDGYLAYVDEDVAGWCQAVERDRLTKIGSQFGLASEVGAWAIGCFLVDPARRRSGLARFMLREILADLRRRGARSVEAFPKRGQRLDTLDLWNGPESMFRAEGFEVMVDDPRRPVLRKAL